MSERRIVYHTMNEILLLGVEWKYKYHGQFTKNKVPTSISSWFKLPLYKRSKKYNQQRDHLSYENIFKHNMKPTPNCSWPAINRMKYALNSKTNLSEAIILIIC